VKGVVFAYFNCNMASSSSTFDVITIDDDDMSPTTSESVDKCDYISKLPDDLIWKILSWLCEDSPWIARLSRFSILCCKIELFCSLSRRWYHLSKNRTLWHRVTIDQRRVPLVKLYQMLRLPHYSQHIVSIRIVSDRFSRDHQRQQLQNVTNILDLYSQTYTFRPERQHH
jgi:hypothetical protein